MSQSIEIMLGPSVGKKLDADRVGVCLSVLCAIHCAITPFLLLFAPAFGKIWSHPASHWGMALFVVPIAIAMLTTGYRRHGKKWILMTGGVGVVLVIIGSILPYIERSPSTDTALAEAMPEEPIADQEEDSEVFIYVKGGAMPEEPIVDQEEDSEVFIYVKGEAMPEASCGGGCTDNCCPSLVTDADGNTRLNIPPASIVTTLGGLSLIVTHIGNLCSCPGCRRRRKLA